MIRLGNKVRDKVSGIEGIAKHGPDPAKWPESMRPKAPAETEPSVAPGC